jgi:lysine 2,3-aminomutase
MSECAVSSSEDPPDQGRAGACASLEEDDEPPSHPRRGTHLFSLSSEHASPSNRFPTPQRLPRFPSNPEPRPFRRRFFPDATAANWSDWHWQLRHRIRNLEALDRIFSLSADEREAVARLAGPLAVCITPYYGSLMSRTDARPLAPHPYPGHGRASARPR